MYTYIRIYCISMTSDIQGHPGLSGASAPFCVKQKAEVLSVWSAKPWANGRWYDASPYFNLPWAICKRFPTCVLEGGCR